MRHQLCQQPGFHPADVYLFKCKLLALSRNESHFPNDVHVVTVGESIRKVCHTVVERVDLIRDLLAQQITVAGKAESTFTELFISSNDLTGFIRGQRSGEFGMWMSGKEAAKRLTCEPATVTGLIERGLLKARCARGGWEIAEASVEEFDRLFVRLSCVAQPLATSSRRLMRLCAANRLETCEIKCRRNGVQPFVRREMVERIMQHSESASAQAKCKQPRSKTGLP